MGVSNGLKTRQKCYVDHIILLLPSTSSPGGLLLLQPLCIVATLLHCYSHTAAAESKSYAYPVLASSPTAILQYKRRR